VISRAHLIFVFTHSIMKKTVLILLLPVILLLGACSTKPVQVGMEEKKWLNSTVASDLIYIEGNVKAYRSSGSYYYFKDGLLAKVTQSLLSADKI
jgi:hypothetical protein